MKFLKGLLGSEMEEKPRAAARMLSLETPPLVFRKDATLPIVDWEAMDPHVPPTLDKGALDAFWTALARKWLEALGATLGKEYRIVDSERFLLLSALEPRAAKVLLKMVERARKRIFMVLDGIARESENGKVCVLVLDGQDRYYDYVSNYDAQGGEYALSGGMFIQRGYGHFVFVASEAHAMEPTIAHELTHCLVQHLPLPAWLNEGIAVNTEHQLHPPGRPFYTPDELHEKHVAFWNETTIQEFWSGKSWRRPDEGNMLSYDMAKHFVLLASQDYGAFCAFANAADWRDGGDAAAQKHLGFPVGNLAEAILGEGPWAPRPEAWKEGIERGQFRRSA
jgi:hypothetical protein